MIGLSSEMGYALLAYIVIIFLFGAVFLNVVIGLILRKKIMNLSSWWRFLLWLLLTIVGGLLAWGIFVLIGMFE